MMRARSFSTAALAGTVLLLSAACGSSTPTPSPAASSSAAGSSSSSAASTSAPPAVVHADVTELKTASSALGTIVTDSAGMTLYMFDKDTKGGAKSSCEGQCLVAWPKAMMGASAPTLTGVTGKVASIDTADGKKQLTLDGWPLYYWFKDTKAGDVSGQAVKGVWWVLDPKGTPIKTKP
ncbi:COG4315 family predicted lipoprotein [Terrabacter sp. 2RAF25]|uniref:COG4315 family predicted lipoprotein n=1 Tax=Terrabacter sp. 2RAF25 TaxID=3232998 RepID=UPI003F94FCBB